MFDPLESRSLFSAGLSFSNGTLTVTGSNDMEIISLAQVSKKKMNASITTSTGNVIQKTYNASSITRIRVNTLGGDDQIHLSTLGRYSKGVFIDAGAGNDLVMGPTTGKISITGGAGRDNIFVGRASATIDLRDGAKDSLTCDQSATVLKDKVDSVFR
jgi:hypothetical protein